MMGLVIEDEETPPTAPSPSTPSGGGAKGYPTVTKWDSGVKRGKGNTIDQKSKWESGVTRGKSNQIGLTKWESGVKRGKGNTLI